MKTIKIILSIYMIVAMVSCQDEKINNTEDETFDLFKELTASISSNYAGNFQSLALSYKSGASTPKYAQAATFYSNWQTLSRIDVGTVQINDINSYTFDVNGINSSYGYTYKNLTNNIPTFGATSTWGITGNSSLGISPFTTTLYVPTLFQLSTVFANREIDRSQDLTLNWNADINNSNNVFISIQYREATSNAIDPAMPDNEIAWQTSFPDNGTYTIPNSVFAQFPSGGIIDLWIGRGNAKLHLANGKNYRILAASIVQQELKFIN